MVKVKKLIAVIMMCGALAVMTGCSNQIPEMTEEQNALVTEYAAGLLLKYHADYNGRLVDTSVPPETAVIPETIVQEIVEEEMPDEIVSDNNVSAEQPQEPVKPALTIAQVLGVEGFDITYQTFEVCDKYPNEDSTGEDLFFSMKAGPGNKLLVLRLNVTNMGSSDVVFDTLSMTDLDCKIYINGSDERRVYVSMLENDFMAINRSFTAGESYETVVITELPETEANTVSSVSMQIINEGRETRAEAIK